MLRVASTWKVSVVGCDQPRAKYCAKNVSIIEVEGRSVIQPHRLLPKKISSLLTRPRNIHLFTFQDLSIPVEHCPPPTSDQHNTYLTYVYRYTMLSIIQTIFRNKLIEDDRSPLFTFTIADHDLGLFPPAIGFWIQVLAIVILVGIFSCAMWAITYSVIIPNRGSTISYLVGFGVVCPLTLMYPFWLLDLLDVQNKLIRFCSSAIYPVTTMFHTLEGELL